MVVPQAVGGDINCGVRLLATNLQRKDVEKHLDALEPILRRIYFEGGRSIALSQQQRLAIITKGLSALEKENDDGIWRFWDQEQHLRDLTYTRHQGGFDTQGKSFGLEDYLDHPGISRDSQIGSIGGGNHFVELQYVDKVHDAGLAYQWGLKKNQLVIMVHSGSVSIGYLCGSLYKSLVKKIYQQFGLKFPANGIFPLPNNIPEFHRFWTMLHNAANFAFANRLFLGLMMKQSLSQIFGKVEAKLIYDTPHNLVWPADALGYHVHRKGTSPAQGWEWSVESGLDWMHGEPVLIPGSMGSASFIMEGQGNAEALRSASHGAGRSLSRGKALKHDEKAFEEFLKKFRIITPIDPKRQDIKSRKDILKQWHDALKKEAPFAYKNVYPVVDTLRDAKIAKPVAEVQPILTLKGH
jgi:tRNA-splicing ligase RtcB